MPNGGKSVREMTAGYISIDRSHLIVIRKWNNVTPHITIRAEKVNGIFHNENNSDPGKKYYSFTISDNGIGFEARYNERIFDLFQRLHSRNDYSGTGIGLSICTKIVENHKGFITANGEPGKGATFNIYLPA